MILLFGIYQDEKSKYLQKAIVYSCGDRLKEAYGGTSVGWKIENEISFFVWNFVTQDLKEGCAVA